jgi:hypothetical protein
MRLRLWLLCTKPLSSDGLRIVGLALRFPGKESSVQTILSIQVDEYRCFIDRYFFR